MAQAISTRDQISTLEIYYRGIGSIPEREDVVYPPGARAAHLGLEVWQPKTHYRDSG